jgi:hypothetical protein
MHLEGHERGHHEVVVGLLVRLHEVPIQVKPVGFLLRLVEEAVDAERLIAGSPIERDDALAKHWPTLAEGVADLHASQQP